jgi:hypothetical protein
MVEKHSVMNGYLLEPGWTPNWNACSLIAEAADLSSDALVGPPIQASTHSICPAVTQNLMEKLCRHEN